MSAIVVATPLRSMVTAPGVCGVDSVDGVEGVDGDDDVVAGGADVGRATTGRLMLVGRWPLRRSVMLTPAVQA
ncbi:MAG TPA: hypothetical protein VGF99_07870 [Myxococcota bacterium]